MSVWKDHNTYRYRVQRGGRIVTGSARTREEAVELEAKAVGDLRRHRAGLPPERTLADALVAYLESPYFKVLTHKRRVIGRLGEIEAQLRGERIEDAHKVAERIINRGLELGHSEYTINAPLRILRRVLNVALKQWDWPARPDKLRLLGEDERQVYLDKPEAAALLDQLAGDRQAWAWCALGIYAGLRKNEIEKLDPSFIHGNLLVIPPKSRRGRFRGIPILPPAREALKLVPLTMSYDLMYKRFGVARRAIGRPEVRFHDLRHTFASWLAQAGAEATDIRDLLGHTQISTTSRYTHLNAERLREVTHRILKPVDNSPTSRKLLEAPAGGTGRKRRKAA